MPQSTKSDHSSKSWSVSSGIGMCLALFVGFIGVQTLSFLMVSFVFGMTGGLQMAMTVLITALVMSVTALWTAKDRKLLRMGSATFGTWGFGFLWLILFWWGSELLGQRIAETPMSFMDDYTAGEPIWIVVLLCVIIAVVAPIYEELLFRGVMFGFLVQSKAQNRLWLSIIVSSALFVVAHGQYEAFGLCLIFVLALLFAWARAKTGGLALPIALHMANNAVAMTVFLMG